MKQGDLVVRKSYGSDVLFRIEAVRSETALLKGTDYRLLADAPIPDLSVVRDPESTRAAQQARIKVNESLRKMHTDREKQTAETVDAIRQGLQTPDAAYFEMPGKVLHLDGDGNYLKKSMQLYSTMQVPAYGLHLHEAQMSDMLYRLLPQVRPDIVVITGHDGVLKHRAPNELYSLTNYKNSQNFVNAVRVAREYEKNRDNLVVVAGACQSHFEALLHAGANFASSPGRILIHALDPVYIAIKASFTSIRETINLPDVIHGTISGIDGVGGIETLGRHRVGLPKPKAAASTMANVTMNA
ncbi:sporulation peptidase YabG [Paenibacillus sp. MY03]|jgi:spore coat assembly protein|uniref:Sporulation peptidase YabG n=1 Tax=Paenibacillus agaridevorans TaxID=171404 RepID=A0A2R5EYG5_9BACL|nr:MULTISPECIES: sporulation peptidase YabG [Paenibacillus]OUS70962.1 sporulation peptidase YabG [Paenibacillus sp. MY03]QNK58085.1 sporulation peptidase YabG [Paenibacillus sp. PAMC21692]GBG08421.1 sporulation peptidase YabG [Paenibacillus agaridevorans]